MTVIVKEQVDRKRGSVPAYMQLSGIIKRAIAAGRYKPGVRIPAEAKLAHQYGVSPMTARQAVNVLVEEGLVRRVHGSGTFVRKVEVSTTSFGLEALDNILFDSENLKINILESTIDRVSKDLRDRLGIEEKAPVIRVSRLISHRGAPFAIQISYLPFDPESPVIENMLETTGLGELFLTKSNSGYKKGSLRLYPWVMTEKEVKMLKSAQENAAFKLEYTYFDFHDKPCIFGWFIIPNGQLPLTSKVGVWNEKAN